MPRSRPRPPGAPPPVSRGSRSAPAPCQRAGSTSAGSSISRASSGELTSSATSCSGGSSEWRLMAAAYVAQPKMLTLAFAPQCGSERLRLDRARAGLPPRHTPPAGLPPPASQCQSGSRPLCAALATMRQSRSRAGVRLVFRAWGQANDVLEVLVPACAQPATIATTGARGDLAAPATRRTTSATPERGRMGFLRSRDR